MTVQCPECRARHAADCGVEVFIDGVCIVCLELQRPLVLLPCGHGVCNKDFLTLAGAEVNAIRRHAGDAAGWGPEPDSRVETERARTRADPSQGAENSHSLSSAASAASAQGRPEAGPC